MFIMKEAQGLKDAETENHTKLDHSADLAANTAPGAGLVCGCDRHTYLWLSLASFESKHSHASSSLTGPSRTNEMLQIQHYQPCLNDDKVPG